MFTLTKQNLQMQNQQISGAFHQGLWLDVGTPERLQQAHQLAQQGKLAA